MGQRRAAERQLRQRDSDFIQHHPLRVRDAAGMGWIPARRQHRHHALPDMAEQNVLVGSHIHVPGNLDEDAVGTIPMSTQTEPMSPDRRSAQGYDRTAMMFHWSI